MGVRIRIGRGGSVEAQGEADASPSDLSQRQTEILGLITEGKSNKQIAYSLGITEGTVKQHIAALFRKLKVSNRTMAVYKGLRIEVEDEGDQTGANALAEALALPPKMVQSLRFERRPVTALVVHLAPSRAIDQCRLEAVADLWASLRDHVGAVARDLDGTLGLGRDLVIWFGSPMVHIDDPERAVQAAESIVTKAAEAAEAGFALSIGIATGYAVLSSPSLAESVTADSENLWPDDMFLAPCLDRAQHLARNAGAGRWVICSRSRAELPNDDDCGGKWRAMALPGLGKKTIFAWVKSQPDSTAEPFSETIPQATGAAEGATWPLEGWHVVNGPLGSARRGKVARIAALLRRQGRFVLHLRLPTAQAGSRRQFLHSVLGQINRLAAFDPARPIDESGDDLREAVWSALADLAQARPLVVRVDDPNGVDLLRRMLGPRHDWPATRPSPSILFLGRQIGPGGDPSTAPVPPSGRDALVAEDLHLAPLGAVGDMPMGVVRDVLSHLNMISESGIILARVLAGRGRSVALDDIAALCGAGPATLNTLAGKLAAAGLGNVGEDAHDFTFAQSWVHGIVAGTLVAWEAAAAAISLKP